MFLIHSRSCCLVTKSPLTSCDPWTIAHHAPLSMGFPRQEYWSGLPFPSPEDLPNPGIKPPSPTLAGGLFSAAPPMPQSLINNRTKAQNQNFRLYMYPSPPVITKLAFCLMLIFCDCFLKAPK